MKRNTLLACALLLAAAICSASQVPVATGILILKAEDARRYDKTLEDLMASPKADVRSRAALAAGRIGDDRALDALATLLENDMSDEVAAMAAFAIGEIESVKGADAVLRVLKDKETPGVVRARAVDAAGKIAAANPRDATAKTLGEAIIATLETPNYDREIILPALTAALRARPEKAADAVAKYLTSPDGRVRSDAANTLSRLRAKNANAQLRKMLESETEDVARANAARALGAAEDKDAVGLLIAAATGDVDPRVRVSAITSLATLRDAKAVDPLLARGEALLEAYKKNTRPNHIGNEHSEFLTIATALGRLLANSANERAVRLMREFGNIDKGHSPEAYLARVRIDQRRGNNANQPDMSAWQQHSTLAQIVGEFAVLEPTTDDGKKMKSEAPTVLGPLARAFAGADPAAEGKRMMAAPDVLRAYARFKTADLGEVARIALLNKDVQLRAAAAGVLDDLPPTKENIDALKTAFAAALVTDKRDNDSQLAIMGALFTLDKKESIGVLTTALGAQDYLVRKRAFDLLRTVDSKDVPGVPAILENARKQDKDKVLKYNPALGTKLGQVLNTDIDYRRALSRKNGSIRAVLKTDKGTFSINFLPEDAPLTVDNFVKLARTGYFNGLAVHRVVANFVMQDGDPRGDGNGGPGWSIRCEVNTREYGRGAVGMALSGKDTGGSQWFVTHAPQPHLDGGYTVFGQVSDKDMDVVDKIVRGDKIVSVRIVGR